ncbi:MAG TPA: hypothetical protein VH350_19175 [Candidatus Sulfotelmatobacter sp.]|nr:hypothetical protein [Candidatus Sulfotelmatobacter sp.]
MNLARSLAPTLWIALFALTLAPVTAAAQSCQTASDLDDATRAAITSSGQRLFAMATKGDTASLRQNSMPSLAGDFGGIENTVKDHQKDLAAAQATVKGVFLLDGSTPSPHAEFYCGVFGKSGQTANSAVFYLDNLPAGKYGVVLFDANSPQGKTMFSLILQQAGTDWKLAGLYILPGQVAGHDSDWFLNKAREYKAKGQMHNAWFYFLEGRSLVTPLPFMSTLATDKLYDEAHSVQPADLPVGKTADLQAGTTTYKLISMFPQIVGNDLDLIVKYQAADISNTNVTYQSNVNVIKAIVAKYPEVRDAFAAIVARAVDPTGRDYGTLLAMKDIK